MKTIKNMKNKLENKLKSKTGDFWIGIYSFIFAIVTLPIVMAVTFYISYLLGKIDEMTSVNIEVYMHGIGNSIVSFILGVIALFLTLVFIVKRKDREEKKEEK